MDKRNTLNKPRVIEPRTLISALVLAAVGLVTPVFVQSPYYLTLLITAGVGAMLAMTFVLQLKNGLVSMGIAVFWGIGAYISVMLVMKFGVSFWLCLPISTVAVGLIGLVVGLVLIRNPEFSFVIMTMILAMVFVVSVGSTKFLGGYGGIQRIPRPSPIDLPFLPLLEFESNMALYYLMLALLFLVVIVFAGFYASSIGRAWTVIGLNDQLAESLGINTFRYRLVAFVLACATAGLVGAFYGHFLGTMNPESFNLFKTVYVHVYAILGGVQFPFLGPIVGALVMVFFPEYMRIAKDLEVIITGGLLIVLVIFLPRGILSLPGLHAFVKNPVRAAEKLVRFFRVSGRLKKRAGEE